MSLPPPPLPPFAQQLGYAGPGPRRPGMLTAVGIISVVIACLGVLMNCGGLVQAIMFNRMRAVMATTITTPATAPVLINPNTLSPPRHQTVLLTLNEVTSLTPARLRLLDQLLMEAGTEILPIDESLVTPQSVRRIISESGRLPDAPGQTGNDFFVLSTGRIEISDTEAVFRPMRGQPVRVPAVDRAADPIANTGQARVFATTSFATTAVVPGPGAAMFAGLGQVAVYMGIDAAVHLLLAALLLVCGILVLRDSPRGRKWHIAWSWIKLPLAALGGVVYWLQTTTMMNNMGTMAPMPVPAIGIAMVMAAFVQVGIICAYPVAVLIVMHTKSIRAYYNGAWE